MEKSGYKYSITGAMAASYFGRARTTRDIDFRIQIKEADLDSFFDNLENQGLKINRNRIKRQLASGYNVLEFQDSRSPYRVDFIIDNVTPISRRKGIAFGVTTFYDTPESLILSKLRMIRATVSKEKSYKDREDIREILATTKVDNRRIVRQAKEQNTLDILRPILTKQRSKPRKILGQIAGIDKGKKPFHREKRDRF